MIKNKKSCNLPIIIILTFSIGIIFYFIFRNYSFDLNKDVNYLKTASQQLKQFQKEEELKNKKKEDGILDKIAQLYIKQNELEKQGEIQNDELEKQALQILELMKMNLKREYKETVDNPGEIFNGLEQDDPKILKEIRENYLEPPSPKDAPYNFTDQSINKYNGTDPSQEGIAKRVLQILGGDIKDGIFVESGANDGEKSNTIMLERDYNWTGVLIEPQPVSLVKLFTKNRKAWISNVCSSPYTKPMKMKFNQISSYDVASHLLINRDENHLKRKGDFITVLCFPIYSVLAALNYTIVDYFSLDVESVEFDVLKTIPFDKIMFKVITVEMQLILEVANELVKYMATKGYTFVGEVNINYIFAHNSTYYAKKIIAEKEEKLKLI